MTKKFNKIYESIINEENDNESKEDAPNYRKSNERGKACGNCIHSENVEPGKGGYCEKYDFHFDCGYICDSYKSSI